MDYIRLDYEAKVHWLVDRYSTGEDRTACGLVIENGITGATGYRQLIDCKRCNRSLVKEN